MQEGYGKSVSYSGEVTNAAKRVSPLDRLSALQGEADALISTLRAKLNPIRVGVPEPDQSDSAKASNQLQSVVYAQTVLNDRLRILIDEIDL